MKRTVFGQTEAQRLADQVRFLRGALDDPEFKPVLDLSPEQQARFDDWCRKTLEELAGGFDIDTTDRQKRLSWGLRVASTLGGIAICIALVLFVYHYWGYLATPMQVVTLIVTPLAALAGAEYAAERERTLYFTWLLTLVSLTAFIMNLVFLGDIFNIASTENALLAWGAFAMLLAYRYGLRTMLVAGLVLLLSWASAFLTARLGYAWFDWHKRPEHTIVLGAILYTLPQWLRYSRPRDFERVYRAIGALAIFTSMLSLAEWGASSYLPLAITTVEPLYEFAGLCASAACIWQGIRRGWNEVVNAAAIFFGIFLFCRLYHWWWSWMPKYLFFAAIGAIGVVLVLAFKRVRARTPHVAEA